MQHRFYKHCQYEDTTIHPLGRSPFSFLAPVLPQSCPLPPVEHVCTSSYLSQSPLALPGTFSHVLSKMCGEAAYLQLCISIFKLIQSYKPGLIIYF